MPRVLGEREQLRALLLIATACGASRIGAIVEAHARYSELEDRLGHGPLAKHGPALLGAFLAAAVIHRRDARRATWTAAAAWALGSLLSTAGIAVIGSVLSWAGIGALGVASYAFAAKILVPDEQHVSASRFAGMATFVFARVAMTYLGTIAWSWVPYAVRDQARIAHGVATGLAVASVAAVAFAVPRGERDRKTLPAQPVYRAASRMDDPATPAAPKLWPALRPFVAPAALFAFSTSAAGYRMSSGASNLLGGVIAIVAATYFGRAWRRHTAVSLVEWYARGLMVAAAGWILMGAGVFVGAITLFGALATAAGGTVAGLSFGLVALAARGRGAGVALASWLLLSSVAASISESYRYGVGVMLLLTSLFGFVIASSLKRRAKELEASL